MAARPMASATISFGLVSIPVKLFTTTESAEQISFRMIHQKCGTPLKYRYWCTKENKAVERDEIVKGYEHAKDQFVLLTPEEIKALEEEATKAIAIEEFIPVEKIDPVYFDKGYYLAPDKGGARAYRLLSMAMKKKQLIGLAKYAARGKQYLVMVRPMEDGLIMQQLRYAKEVRPFKDVPIEGKNDIKDSELKLALQLIEQSVSKEFKPENYENDVSKRVMEVIQQKVEGEEITIAPGEEPKAQVIDLMEALKASLSEKPAVKKKAKPAKASPRKAKKTTRKKASQ